MKKHTSIYVKYFGIGEQDVPRCEVCSSSAVDIHHIERRGMGGSKTKDYIDNLMALCRRCHELAEAGKLPKEMLKVIHLRFMKEHGIAHILK